MYKFIFNSLFLLLIITIPAVNGFAQQTPPPRVKIVQSFHNDAGTMLEAVSAELFDSKGKLIKAEISDKNGTVEFSRIDTGHYFIKAGMVGYENYQSGVFAVTGDKDLYLPVIVMAIRQGSLKEVTVESKKPFIERQLDKIVLNVESSITSAGSSVMDIISKAPAVAVDQNDNVSIKGKNGVIIMIDGKPVQLSGVDLANMLKAMPASSVDKIEIISNPSAKYDASGSAGIINIRLKKDQRMGWNGSITAGYSQGFYPKYNSTLTLNYRNKKWNFFGSYTYSYRKMLIDLLLLRDFYQGSSYSGGYIQKSFFTFPYSTHVGKTGFDYFISKKVTVGTVLSTVTNGFSPRNDEQATVTDANKAIASYYITRNRSKERWSNYAGNVNLKYTIDTTGRELTIDLDHARYWNTTDQGFFTDYFDAGRAPNGPSDTLLGNIKGDLKIYSVKSDLSWPLNPKEKIEAGIKSSWVKADNDLKFYTMVTGVQQYDAGRSNHFIYDEQINAAYINYRKDLASFSVQVGVRAEQTNAKGKQLTSGRNFDTSYLKLFPSFFISKKAGADNEFSLSLSKRIDRPTYRQLNPFRFYIDPTTYAEGNPYLRPQFTYSYELTWSWKQKLFTTLGYSRTTSNMTTVILPEVGQQNVTLQTDVNIKSFDYYGVNISATFNPVKWWNNTNNLNIYYGHYSGNILNTGLSDGNVVADVSSNNTLSFTKILNAEVNVKYTSKGIYGFFYVNPTWNLSVGVQRNILKSKATIKLNVSDIFWSDYPHGVSNFFNETGGFSEYFSNRRDTRVAAFSFTYRFGKKSVSAVRVKTGGAEDEKRRAAAGG